MRVLLTAALAIAAATSTHGSIIFLGQAPAGGAGLGNRMTTLTLQSPGSSTMETGCVGPNDSTTGCGFADAQVQTGESQTKAYTVGELGLSSFGALRILFNAAQPGNSTGINLNELELTIYSTTNNDTATFTLANPQFLDATFLGVGQAGYQFGLDDAQAATANAFLAANPGLVVGLGASLGCEGANCEGAATGGLDTFALALATPGDTPGDTPIPEPSAAMLFLSGVATMVVGRKLRS